MPRDPFDLIGVQNNVLDRQTELERKVATAARRNVSGETLDKFAQEFGEIDFRAVDSDGKLRMVMSALNLLSELGISAHFAGVAADGVTPTAWLDADNGKWTSGGGKVTEDENGFSIKESDIAAAVQSYKFISPLDDTVAAWIAGYGDAGNNKLDIEVFSRAAASIWNKNRVHYNSGDGGTANVALEIYDDAVNNVVSAIYATDRGFGFIGNNTGWISAVWLSPTRTGATTFTVAEDVSAIIGKGDKLKFTDTTTKYLVVASAVWNAGTGLTTITTYATSDYAFVGNPSAISYSHLENPLGWPEWFNFTPTITVAGGTAPTYTANFVNRYTVKGKQVTVSFTWVNAAGGVAGAGAAALICTLPVTASSNYVNGYSVIGYGIEFENGGTIGDVGVYINTTANIGFSRAGAASLVGNDQSSASRYMMCTFTYEI
jgi:hypothetical protein